MVILAHPYKITSWNLDYHEYIFKAKIIPRDQYLVIWEYIICDIIKYNINNVDTYELSINKTNN